MTNKEQIGSLSVEEASKKIADAVARAKDFRSWMDKQYKKRKTRRNYGIAAFVCWLLAVLCFIAAASYFIAVSPLFWADGAAVDGIKYLATCWGLTISGCLLLAVAWMFEKL